MNFDRIYEYRFKGVNPQKKQLVWKEISQFVYRKLDKPEKIIDPAAGLCEFINNVPSSEKWAVDLNEEFLNKHANSNIKKIIGNSLEVELPQNYFDAVFISNFLEHLNSQEEVSLLLTKLYNSLKKGGKIAILGPNFKYTSKEYFDFADHTVILTDQGVAEHLYGAGFDILVKHSKFLPLSFRSNNFLPISKFTVNTYLNLPFVWKILGKQFLVIGEKK